MGWYRVVKTIKGHRYLYEQRTWREGKHVRTESRYIGPAEAIDGGVTTTDISEELEPLAAEARKYKSAEAFIKAQGKPLYHGSPKADIIRKEGFRLLSVSERRLASAYGDGIYFSTKKSGAYDTTRTRANTVEAYVPKDLKLYPAYDKDAGTINTQKLKNDGYDGVEVFLPSGERHITVFDPSIIKTKQQLIDLYNRVHGATSTAPCIFYHGSRRELTGSLEPSASGTFGPGFYLTTKARATLYAQHDARIAAKIAAGELGQADIPPEHDGAVYAFDLSRLRLKVLTWERYLDDCKALDPQHAATPAAKAKFQAILAEQGYDGLYVPDDIRHELVIFPSSMSKL